MKIKRTIMLIFSIRATMLVAGCGDGLAGEGEQCDDGNENGGGDYDPRPNCKEGLYCSISTGTCQPCDEDSCGSSSTSPTPGPNEACELVDDATACGNNGELLLHCPLDLTPSADGYGTSCYSLEPTVSDGYFCCRSDPQTCSPCDGGEDATRDANDDADDAATED
jgi:hypothetical protein